MFCLYAGAVSCGTTQVMTGSALVQLYWNWRAQAWQDTEDYSYNGGSTLGVQWFMPPPFVEHVGGNKFRHLRVMKFSYEMLEVMTPDGTGYRKETIWIGEKISPPSLPRETDQPTKMPFVTLQDPTETQSTKAFFVPVNNTRVCRGADAGGGIARVK